MEGFAENSLKGLKILLVEDNLVNQQLTGSILKKWGVIVDYAENGKTALSEIEAGNYDLVLMDINMPEMDGFDTTLAVRSMQGEKFQNLPIFALTRIDTPEYLDEIHACGMNGYIPGKPLDVERLYRKIKQFLK
ncbi:MAG: response regulator [Bacteroidota bacterium]